MRKLLIILLISTSFVTSAAPNPCTVVGSSMEQTLFNSVMHDLNISADIIQRNKTAVQIINISSVSEVFAKQLARIDYSADKQRNVKALLPEEDYFESYYTNGTKNITAKYTYINHQGKRDAFIASNIINNDECSVRFNGYLTVSREF